MEKYKSLKLYEKLQKLHKLHTDLVFLPERVKIKVCDKRECFFYNNKNRVIKYKALETCIKPWIVLLKVHCVIEFNQEVWLKEYIYLQTKFKAKTKNRYWKRFLQVYKQKDYEILKRHRDIKLVSTEKRTTYLALQPIYHTLKWFPGNLLANEMSKTKETME